METTITMTAREQRRAWILTKVLKGQRSMAEAAQSLGLSERQLWRLRTAFERDGPAGVVHGNRGRAAPRRLDETLRRRVVELAGDRYAGLNDCHLAELLAEREAIVISRPSLQRILPAAGLPAKRRRRRPRHRSRRERMAAEGTLLQLDGSRHPWLEDRAPQMTLVAAIDDATGKVLAATFRQQEDAAGYLEILREIRELRRANELRWIPPFDQPARRSRSRRARDALWARGPTLAGLVHHSDRGVQYLAMRYTERLAEVEAVSSVGSRGDSYDNALAESVIGLYKAELIARHGPWSSIDQAELATARWVDFWNTRRLHSACGDVPPAEFEAAYHSALQAAAVAA